METEQQMVMHYILAYKHFDVDAMCRDMSRKVVFQHMAGVEAMLDTNGPEAFKAQAGRARELFSEREQTITNILSDPDSSRVSINYRGVLAEDILEETRDGDTPGPQGTSTFHFEEEKSVKIVDKS